MSNDSRRAFLGVMTAAPAALLGGTVAASAAERRGGRRVVGGSPYATFSRAVAFDGIVFVAGVVGQKPGSRELAAVDFAGQCRQAMENLKTSVEASGSTMDKVLKCNCFLTDVADFGTFNKIYTEFFTAGPPARSTVVVKELVVPGAKLEIDCVTCVE